MIRVCELLLQIESISKLWLLVTKMKAKVTMMNINKLHRSLQMYGKSTLNDYTASLEPQPKLRYSEHLAFVLSEPFLTQLVQSCTQQLVTTVIYRSVLYRTLAPRSEKQK